VISSNPACTASQRAPAMIQARPLPEPEPFVPEPVYPKQSSEISGNRSRETAFRHRMDCAFPCDLAI